MGQGKFSVREFELFYRVRRFGWVKKYAYFVRVMCEWPQGREEELYCPYTVYTYRARRRRQVGE